MSVWVRNFIIGDSGSAASCGNFLCFKSIDFGQIEDINWRQPTCSYKTLEIKSLVDHHTREFLIGVVFSGQIEEINWHQRTYFNHIDNLKSHTRLIKLKSQNVDHIKSSDIDFNPTFSFILFLPFLSDILLVRLHPTSYSSVSWISL